MRISLNTFVLTFLLVVIIHSCKEREGQIRPEAHGMSSDSLQAASALMQDYIDQEKLSCISTLVMKDGHLVERSLYGFSDVDKQTPLREDQLFRIFSLGKPITTVALMILYEEGKFELDDPIERIIPEFGETEVYLTDTDPPVMIPQNHPVTFRELLSNTSGMTYGWDPYNYVDSLYNAQDPVLFEQLSLSSFSKAVAGLPLKWQPGSRWENSVSFDIAAYLVEIISGVPFNEFLKMNIFIPLGMDDTGFQVPEVDRDRLAMIYKWNYQEKQLEAAPEWLAQVREPVKLYSGGEGLVSSIEDYALFGQMLLNEGELNGHRILQPETVQMILSNQLPQGVIYQEGIGFGLGGALDPETGEYFWHGLASTFFWADPEKDLLILCFSHFLPPEKYRFGQDFREMVRSAVKK